jgi:elongation of very long chain fatty acids protein 6
MKILIIRKIDTYTEIGDLQKHPVAGYWAFVWCVSKIPELIDTLFIVLRKKPLMFMHW